MKNRSNQGKTKKQLQDSGEIIFYAVVGLGLLLGGMTLLEFLFNVNFY